MLGLRTKTFIFLLSFLFLLGGGLSFLWPRIEIGVAYKAKILCSGVFVSKRQPESILTEDLGADDLSNLKVISTHIDHSQKIVSASFLGIIKKAAKYKPLRGCSLIYDRDIPTVNIRENFDPKATSEQKQEEKPRVHIPFSKDKTRHSISNLVDQNRLEAVLEWGFSEPHPTYLRRTRAVVILYQGQIIAERYAPGISKTTPLLGWSMSKSVMNTMVGILIYQGKLTLDDPVPVDEWQKPGDLRAQITLKHLLHMTSGLEFNEDNTEILNDVNTMLLDRPDMAGFAAKKELAVPVGSSWSYSSGTTNIIAGILRKIIGENAYLHFLYRHFFEPLDMLRAVMETDPSGTLVGASFMYASARDWAKIGQLFLQDGVWDGHRILPEGWVKFSTTPVPQSPHGQYGAHFWLRIPREFQGGNFSSILPPDAYHAVGHEGQFLSIIPSRELVVVRLGFTRYAEAWNHAEFLNMILDALHP